MFETRLNQLPEYRPHHPLIASVASQILEQMDSPVVWRRPAQFTPLALFVFGSALDSSRFDRRGLGTSDLDFLAVVAEDFFVDNLYFFGSCLTPDNVVSQAHLRHHPGFSDNQWDGGRRVDLLLVSSARLSDILRETEEITDQDLKQKLTGRDDAWYYALATGFAMVNHLDDRLLRPLLRLRNLATRYT